jgi:predicted PurR-regulated permease PerM
MSQRKKEENSGNENEPEVKDVGAWDSEREPTPIPISKRAGIVVAILCVIAFVLVVYFAPSALYIAAGGFALALVLSFPVDGLSRFMRRGLAILVTYLVLVGLLVVSLVVVVPILIEQLGNLISTTPDIANSADQLARDLLKPLADRNLLSGSSPEEVISNLLDRLEERAQDLARNLLGGLVDFVSGTVGFAVNFIGALFVSVYLLLDVRRIKAAYLRALPHRYRWDGKELWNAEGTSLSKYLGGLALVIVIQGSLTTLGLFLLGVPYAIVLGAWVSATAIIPYLGAFLGAIPGLIVAFFISPTTGLLTAILYLGIQQLEGNVLTPRIQGQALLVHPIVVLLAIVIGGELGGLVGVIVAVPVLAVLRVLFDFIRARLEIKD